MATFLVYEGAPGQGKSILMAKIVKNLVIRNKKLTKKYPELPKRYIYSNIKFSIEFEEFAGEYLKYWTNTSEIVKVRDVDIVWDEIATELDSRNYLNLSDELKRFLSQYRKRGIDIYANTQDFSMVDARARLMITGVYSLKKAIGSRDISATKPYPPKIWGIIFVWSVKNYREIEPEKKRISWLDSQFFFITKELVSIYDTTQDIPAGELPPLRHVERICEKCSHKKIEHK